MTLTAAKTYVARVIGGQNDAAVLALAADAIIATANKWSNRHAWSFLRRDNSTTRALAGTVSGAGLVFTVTSTAGLNPGQTVTGASLAAGATISTVDSLTQITLSSAATTGAQTLTFGAYIPIIAGTDSYFAPADYYSGYSMLLLTTKQTLEYIQPRLVDRILSDQTQRTQSTHYTDAPYATNAGFTAADQRARLRVIGIPGTTESGLLRYYRQISGTADPVDILDAYLYQFLDDAKAWLVVQKNANDPRITTLVQLAERGLMDAINSDSEESEDENIRLISQYEAFQDGTNTRGLPDTWY